MIGGFRIDSLLGQGGMGKVYRATQLRLSRPVALKVLPPEFLARGRKRLDRFIREAQIAAQLSHPNIVQVYDAGEDSGVFFMAMELLDGRDLREEVSRRGPLSEEYACDVFLQCGRALEAALEKNLIHRDIKPDNIMITSKGMVKVADFGLARDLASAARITAPGAVIGTPAFMSPEQGTGEEVDHRSDLYSLGATMYFALTARFPYMSDKPAEIIRMHVEAPVPDPRDVRGAVSDETAAMVVRLMAKKPGDRYQVVTELIRDLEAQALRRKILESTAQGGELSSRSETLDPVESPASPTNRMPDSDTLDMPDGALGAQPAAHARFAMETIDESGPGEDQARLTVAEVESAAFRVMPDLPRTQGLDSAVLVAPGDPLRKVFVFSREVLRTGRQTIFEDPRKGVLKIDAVIRALPCRSRELDPENYAKNLAISRHHADFRIGPSEVLIENAGSGSGLSVDGRKVEPGRPEPLPEKCTVLFTRNSMRLDVALFGAEAAGRVFSVEGEPPLPGARLIGMDGSSRVAAVRIDRPENAPNHSYVLLVRQASIGEGDDCAVRITGTDGRARLVRYGEEFFVAAAAGVSVAVDGMAVLPGMLAPLCHGSILRAGAVEMKFRAIIDDDFKNP